MDRQGPRGERSRRRHDHRSRRRQDPAQDSVRGIDAPEKGQAFGERSKQNLSALVFEKRVGARCHKKDRYGREVCAVFVGMTNVGFEQIRAGMAWHYKEYQHEQTTQDRLVYRDEEDAAKAAKRGLWTDAKPVPPWEWRPRK